MRAYQITGECQSVTVTDDFDATQHVSSRIDNLRGDPGSVYLEYKVANTSTTSDGQTIDVVVEVTLDHASVDPMTFSHTLDPQEGQFNAMDIPVNVSGDTPVECCVSVIEAVESASTTTTDDSTSPTRYRRTERTSRIVTNPLS